MAAPNKPPVLSQGVSVSQPDDNKTSVTKEAAGGLATVSTALDPMPHYGLAAASLAGSAYYMMKKPPQPGMLPFALAVAGLGYGYGGYCLSKTDRSTQRFGYDVSVASSALLAGATLPTVFSAGLFADLFQTAFATVGTISLVGNTNKAYQMRTGQPKDLNIQRK
ncbi:hypothetical protein DFJ74DRAFT_700607 [Hyaloraphidium curvatum]|nr:hypothetical protein DFJ74DRAFT_700607 [Hyaloraphidium curvatum]